MRKQLKTKEEKTTPHPGFKPSPLEPKASVLPMSYAGRHLMFSKKVNKKLLSELTQEGALF